MVLNHSWPRGDWVDDQQHGFGAQRWSSGAVYCGTWDHNTVDGWGAYFCPRNTPTPHNPHSEQMIFLGYFQNGCPTDGLVIECTDFRELTAENFTTQHETTIQDISAQPYRVYDVSYDGVSAFWQLPIPKRKIGLFDLKFKLCEYEVRRVDRPLTHKRSLEEIWYKWIPNPNKEKKADLNTRTEGNGDKEKYAGEDTSMIPKAAPKEMAFEMFHFHGTSVRDKRGQFPCPTEGTLSVFPRSKQKPMIKYQVEYKAKFKAGSGSNPTLQYIEGKTSYGIPADTGKF